MLQKGFSLIFVLVWLVLATINKLSERMLWYFTEKTICAKDKKSMWFYALTSAYYRVLSQVFCCVIIISFIIVNMNIDNFVLLLFMLISKHITPWHCWYNFFLYFINIICNNYYENIFFSRQLDFRLSNIIIRYFWTQIFAKPFFFKILFEDMQKCYAILWNQIKKILCSSHCCLTFIAYDIAVKILVIAISWCFVRFGCDHNNELYIYHDIWIQKKSYCSSFALQKLWK